MELSATPSVQDAGLSSSGDEAVSIISMHDFLDFLKLTCQVNEHLEADLAAGNQSKLDFNVLAKNPLINSLQPKTPPKTPTTTTVLQRQEAVQKSGSSVDKKEKKKTPRRQSKDLDSKDTQTLLKHALQSKLNEVLEEGILDSVLQYMGPPPVQLAPNRNAAPQTSLSKPQSNIAPPAAAGPIKTEIPEKFDVIPSSNATSKNKANIHNVGQTSGRDRYARRKSLQQTHSNLSIGEVMVTIHVCDEVKTITRDFVCQQGLLVSKMGYFADVTAGQRLEDMDISVHCDVQIFEWLMRWVKRESIEPELWPQLDATNVVPILVSASFLQMEPLLVDCLSFCHANLSDVIRVSANMSCLNDSIISRLAAMFTNLELEVIKDKKDRFVPRLWTKFIQSLCETEPQSLRGHFSSMADLFRCTRCSQYITQSVSSFVYCVPQNMRLNRWGQVISQHVRDPSWSLTNYVAALHKELRSWRKVYWRLWGNCHYLYCVTCESHFPANRMKWCLYHPEAPQFLGPVTEGRMAGPTGRFPCCGQQAFRYEPAPGPIGCQYREHTVQIESDRDRAIMRHIQTTEIGGCVYEAPPQNASNTHHLGHGSTSSGTNEQWWHGMALAPDRDNHGLLPTLSDDNKHTRMRKQCTVLEQDSSSEQESGDTLRKYRPMQQQISTSSDGCESEDLSSPRPISTKPRRKPAKRIVKLSGRHWSGDISARSNQDNQREFEERAMKQVIAIVGKRTGSDTSLRFQNYHQGGMYVKLEADWRESVRHKLAGAKPPKK